MPDDQADEIPESTWNASTRVLALVAVVFVCSLVLIATRHGIGVSNDGVSYLRQAEAFAAHGDLYVADLVFGSPTHYPPGWSLLVGAVSASTGLSVLVSARLVNTVAIGVLVLVSCRAMAGTGRRIGWIHIAGALYFCLTYTVYWTATYALSETVFLVLVVLSLLCLERFDRANTYGYLIGAAAFAGAAGLVRYVGVVLLVPIAVSALRSDKGGRSRLASLAWVAVLTLGPIAMWVLAAPESTRPGGHLSPKETVAELDDVLLSAKTLAASLAHSYESRFGVAFYGLLGVIALAILIVGFRQLTRGGSAPDSDSVFSRVDQLALLPWMLFGVSYVTLVAAQRWWASAEILERYWAPFVLVVVVMGARLIDEAISNEAAGERAAKLALLFFLIAGILNLQSVAFHANDGRSNGLGLETLLVRSSPLSDAIAELPGEVVLTNSPFFVEYFAPDKVPMDILSHRGATTRVVRPSHSEQRVARTIQLRLSSSIPATPTMSSAGSSQNYLVVKSSSIPTWADSSCGMPMKAERVARLGIASPMTHLSRHGTGHHGLLAAPGQA